MGKINVFLELPSCGAIVVIYVGCYCGATVRLPWCTSELHTPFMKRTLEINCQWTLDEQYPQAGMTHPDDQTAVATRSFFSHQWYVATVVLRHINRTAHFQNAESSHW